MEVSHKTGLMPLILMLAFALSIPYAAAARQDFTVTLNSGTSFETLRQPQQAPWDPEVVLVLTDSGNWIALAKADIQTITASIEQSGLGTVIDSKTIAIGRLQDDQEEEDEDGEGAASDPTSALNSFLEGLSTNSQPVYNTEQFVNPGDAGVNAGFPADYAIEP